MIKTFLFLCTIVGFTSFVIVLVVLFAISFEAYKARKELHG